MTHVEGAALGATRDEEVEHAPARPGVPRVRIEGVSKTFRRNDGSIVHAVDEATIEVGAGEFVVLLGPSGCGKTTLLRAVVGLERPDAGAITIDDRPVFSAEPPLDVPSERRRISMVFQSYALWPHLTALDNVAFPLRAQRVGKRDARARASRALEMVGIGALAAQYPAQMSGGQQQRVALARALAPGSNVILFDEPLSNVDAKVREELRLEITTMQRELGFSALYVTHDQSEALEMAHRIAVMRTGRIVQLGTPEEIYAEPATRYVGEFIGTANLVAGTVGHDHRGAVVRTAHGDICATASGDFASGDRAVALFRPEACHLSMTEPPPGTPNVWPGRVHVAMFAGSHVEYVVSTEDIELQVWTMGHRGRLSEGEPVWVNVDPTHIRLLPEEAADDSAAEPVGGSR